MSVAFELKAGLVLSEELSSKLRKFFSDDGSGHTSRIHSRTNSMDSETSSLDAEKPAGAEEWDGFMDTQDSPLPEQPPMSWLSSCIVATYSSLEYLLLANAAKWALLARSTSDQNKFDLITMKTLDELKLDERDGITCCCLFRLGSSRPRQSEFHDGLVVSIGTSDGRAAFFTENGTLLFYEQFCHDASVVSLRFEQFEDGQLFTVITTSDIFSINPFSLNALLNQAKSSIAKRERTAEEVSNELELECERLQLDSRSKIRHAIFTGMEQPSSFQQYTSASLEDFRRPVTRSTLPSYLTFFVNTDSMFATFAWYNEGEGASVWSDAVARIKTSIVPHFGFRKFLGLSTASDRNSALSRTRRTMQHRGVLDDSRSVFSISKAPAGRQLIAVADQTARVLLIDTEHRQIVRIWKAYRDASLAWVTSSHEGRSAVFLVVFAPRRALLEVWSVQNGSRVGAQHVDPDGCLLEGGESFILCGRGQQDEDTGAYFADSQGNMFEIVVPFHLALMRTASHEQHDQILMSKMPSVASEFTVESFLRSWSTLRTQKARRQSFLSAISLVSDTETLASFLRDITQEDSSRSLGDLPSRMESHLALHRRLLGYCRRPATLDDDVTILTTFNEQSQGIIRQHLGMGPSLSSADYDVLRLVSCYFPLIDWHSETTAIFEKNIPDADLQLLCRLIFQPVLNGVVDTGVFIDDIIPLLPYSVKDVCSLFSFYMVTSLHCLSGVFSRVVDLMTSLSMEAAEDWQHRMDTFEKTAVDSCHTSRAVVLFAAVSLSRKRVIETMKATEKKKTDGVEEDPDCFLDVSMSDWDAVDPVAEHADCALLLFHVNHLAAGLKGAGPPRGGANYAKLLHGAGGYIREQVAAWAVEQQLSLDEFDSALSSNDSLRGLCELLPLATTPDLLCCDIGWEHASHWFKQRDEWTRSLRSAVSFVSRIAEPRLCQGAARLLWEKFLADGCRSVSALIEKTGRPPKEREVRQAVQMEERHLVDFLDCCVELMSVMMDAVRDAPPPSTVPLDQVMEVALSHPPVCVSSSGVLSRDCLATTATHQSLVNYHLVMHHQQLLIAYRLQLRCGLRLRPMNSLFCPVGQRAFFHSLDSHPLIPMERVDDVIMEQRNAFLAKVAEQGDDADRKSARDLAHEWALTVHSIALMQLVSLLRSGADVEAGLALPSQASPQLGTRLARLLAARMLRLAAETETVLTNQHNKYLLDMAGEEAGRVEWAESDWRSAVSSLGKMSTALSLQPHDVTSFVRLGTLATQYWAINWNL